MDFHPTGEQHQGASGATLAEGNCSMRWKLSALGIALASVGAAVGVFLNVGDGANASGCDAGDLKGEYGFSVSGTAIVPPGGTMEQIVGVAVATFDGKDKLTQVDSIHGATTGVINDRSSTGTYTVNADCSGTMILNIPGAPFPIELRIVVVEKGREIRTAVMAGPNLVTSEGRRVD